MYVNQLRWLSFVGHGLKEPFSLLAKDIPAPELPPELDELAQKRALQYFRVILLTTKDAESLNLEPQEIFAADILLDGRRVPVTVDFICASIHWFTLYSLGKYPLPQDWADDFAEYLRLRWPEYKGEPVTHDVLTYWLMYWEVHEREVQAPLERLKNDVKGFYRCCRGSASSPAGGRQALDSRSFEVMVRLMPVGRIPDEEDLRAGTGVPSAEAGRAEAQWPKQ